jgi:hypothetical protein
MVDCEFTETGFSLGDNELTVLLDLVDVDPVVRNAWYLNQNAIDVSARADGSLADCDCIVLLLNCCSHGYSSPS